MAVEQWTDEADRGRAQAEVGPLILTTTRRRQHAAGSDLSGGLAPVGWSFTLPTREVATAIEVAVTPSGALDIVVAADGGPWAMGLDELGTVEPGSVDLIDLGALEDPTGADAAATVARALKPDGVVRAGAGWTVALSAHGLVPAVRLWASPRHDPVSFVPAADAALVDRFRRAGRHHGGYAAVLGQVDGRGPEADTMVLFQRTGGGDGQSPPAWLCQLAADAGMDLRDHRWGLWARSNYASQKAVMFLHQPGDDEPDLVVKVPRTPRFNHRLENEAAAIEVVRRIPALAPTVPATAFSGWHGELFVLASHGVPGPSMPTVTAGGRNCPLAQEVIRWVTTLGAETTTRWSPAEVAVALADVVERFEDLYRPSADLAAFLRRQVDIVSQCADPIPLVLMHGNVTDWNVIVPSEGPLVLVDWEFAERTAPPLWDLLFFLRMNAWRPATGWRRLVARWRPRRDTFLDASEAEVLRRSIQGYCQAVDVPQEIIEPLFHLCWVHLCLNEATHRTPQQLARSTNLAILQRGVALARAGRLAPMLLGRSAHSSSSAVASSATRSMS